MWSTTCGDCENFDREDEACAVNVDIQVSSSDDSCESFSDAGPSDDEIDRWVSRVYGF